MLSLPRSDLCIPYRLVKDDEGFNSNLESRIEVLMISSPNRDDLVFPKGGWENDETAEEAAQREALEEAGVRGILKDKHLGVWTFRSKSKQHTVEGGCKGYIFAMEVTKELDTWPEQGNHCRKWLSIHKAFELCRYEWMREALEKFLRVMRENENHEMNMKATVPCPVLAKDGMEYQVVSGIYVSERGREFVLTSHTTDAEGEM